MVAFHAAHIPLAGTPQRLLDGANAVDSMEAWPAGHLVKLLWFDGLRHVGQEIGQGLVAARRGGCRSMTYSTEISPTPAFSKPIGGRASAGSRRVVWTSRLDLHRMSAGVTEPATSNLP